ncbi:MAG TPA: DUF72 domain-containing protein [Chthoniobacterales bacterium]
MRVRIGCSGWFYWHWRGKFYPDAKRTDHWFHHYTQTFHTVELNAPFYRWPKIATAKAWVRNAPDDFRYSIKVNRLITHEKRMRRTGMLVEEFCKLAHVLGAKMGCFLFQFPPSYHFTASRLRSITSQIDPSFRCAVEFRHKSWWREAVYRAFRQHGLIFCSISAPRLPNELIRTSETIYLRLHGRSRWYRHDYSGDELDEWAKKIAGSGTKEAWIYFDNDREAFAIKNAQDLIRRCRKLGLEVV